MCPFYNAQLFEITGTTKGVFTHSQSSCHIAKVVLAFRHDSRQIPIASDAPPRHTSRGFLHWRLSDDGPGASRIVPDGRHPKPFTKTDDMRRIGGLTLKAHRCHSGHVAPPPRPCCPEHRGRQLSRGRSPWSKDGSALKPFHVPRVPLAQGTEPRWRAPCRDSGARNDCNGAAFEDVP